MAWTERLHPAGGGLLLALCLASSALAEGAHRRPPAEALRLLVKHEGTHAEALAARQRLDPGDAATQDAWLKRGKPAEVMAVLGLETEGVRRLPVATLSTLLEEVRDRMVATAVAKLLGNRRSEEADKVLIQHLASHGRADRTAAAVLARRTSDPARKALFDCGSQLDGHSKACLVCLKGLAKVPGEKVTRLLLSGSTDRTRAIQEASKAALAQRKKLGLPTSLEIKEVPYGVGFVASGASKGGDAGDDDEGGGARASEAFYAVDDPRGGKYLRDRLRRKGASEAEVQRQLKEFRQQSAARYGKTLDE